MFLDLPVLAGQTRRPLRAECSAPTDCVLLTSARASDGRGSARRRSPGVGCAGPEGTACLSVPFARSQAGSRAAFTDIVGTGRENARRPAGPGCAANCDHVAQFAARPNQYDYKAQLLGRRDLPAHAGPLAACIASTGTASERARNHRLKLLRTKTHNKNNQTLSGVI